MARSGSNFDVDAGAGVGKGGGASGRRRELFPLPFTPFEYYYWTDDRPDYPMAFPFDIRFSGQLDEASFRAALAATVNRHPLLTANVATDSPVPRWIKGPGTAPWVDWDREGAPVTHPFGERLDLTRERGIRAWVRVGEHTTRVILQFHHACGDGLGTVQFLHDLLMLYAHVQAGSIGAPQLPELVPERLLERGRFDADGAAKASLSTAVRDIYISALVWGDILLRRVARLAPPRPPADKRLPERDRELMEFQTRILAAADTKRLRAFAKSRGMTLNDVLARDLLLVLDRWNQANGNSGGGRLRLSVPVNIRNGPEADCPACNRIGFAFVTVRPDALASEEALLTAVNQRMARIKDWKLGHYFLGGVTLAAGFKGLIPRLLSERRCFATAVLTNVGKMFPHLPLPRRDGRLVVGNVVLERISGVPPIRPLTRAGVAAMEYADELSLAARCDPRYFSRDASAELLDAYVKRLEQTARQAT